ncbi:short-chain dehydrogenase [Rhizocola hellebori]|uniref:Short-chain dehydrogenase n=1 Tax=Rhizocola hellebori TaxID=1392758 RepID=A0A8J3VMH5_9ACTN|nr:SDR family NAD(P)-dependent oxidoreductase [Rhizocola hellebori]GIH11682.1 short-chain dehydrogenase [Rhizocola hellebori]
MEDLTRHIVITGASSGIGRAAATEMESRGWRVTRIGRNQERLGPNGLVADFADLAQVRAVAEKLKGQRIDVIANNAGLVKGGTTVDGFHTTMQVNHLAPFLLTYLLRDQMPDGARMVNTSSAAWNVGADPSPPGRRFPSKWLAYATSKRANVYFAAEAARRWPTLRCYSFHPGVPRTRFGPPAARLFYRFAPGLTTPQQGADQLIWLSTAPPEELVDGAYYVSRRAVARPDDKAAASRLWEATASLLELPG